METIKKSLINSGLATDELLVELEKKSQKKKIPLVEYLLESKHISEDFVSTFYKKNYGFEYLEKIPTQWVDTELISLFSISFLKKNKVVPLYNGSSYYVAITSPEKIDIVHDMSFIIATGIQITPIFMKEKDIISIINQSFGQAEEKSDALDILETSISEDSSFATKDNIEDILDDQSDAPFIKVVNMIIGQAIRNGASDIHIEPYDDHVRVRFRLDGVLYNKHSFEKGYHPALISRIKIMAKLNIAEKRIPQDGRIALSLGERFVDLRVSTTPTSQGERIVMRLLEKDNKVLNLKDLGFDHENTHSIRNLLNTSHGIILVTGPTGSGKTTSLYAMLQEINKTDINIMTIEDPVEYQLEGIGQIQANPKIGLTFASGLRSIVRQDPDVILIGEIRDQETAEIAIQSALTGHLVFSTLHTNDAPSAVARLLDIGVEPFLLSSVLRAVVAQRLIRQLCPNCKKSYVASAEEKSSLQITTNSPLKLYNNTGCQNCMETGYKGRKAIYEIMEINSSMKNIILQTSDANILTTEAKENGMRTLYHSGIKQVLAGDTTLTEILRVTNG